MRAANDDMLPQINERVARADLADEVKRRGWAFLRHFESSLLTEQVFAGLGAIDTVEGLSRVQTLKPRHADEAPPNTYSGNFGTSQFPLHTDLAHWAQPPRFIALRCLRGSPEVATYLLDSKSLIDNIGTQALRRALVQPRRAMKGRKQLLRLLDLSEDTGECRIRWDSIYLRPATPFSKQIFSESLKFLSAASVTKLTLLEIGDLLLIDNWRMLHGRAAAYEGALIRHIDRSYLMDLK